MPRVDPVTSATRPSSLNRRSVALRPIGSALRNSGSVRSETQLAACAGRVMHTALPNRCIRVETAYDGLCLTTVFEQRWHYAVAVAAAPSPPAASAAERRAGTPPAANASERCSLAPSPPATSASERGMVQRSMLAQRSSSAKLLRVGEIRADIPASHSSGRRVQKLSCTAAEGTSSDVGRWTAVSKVGS